MIATKGQGLRDHRLCLAVLPLGPLVLAGCGSPEEPRVQRVAYCHSTDDPGDGFLDAEWSTVMAQGSVSAGTALTAEVPVGAVQIYVDGVQVGAVNEGVDTDGPYSSPPPDEVTYISGVVCPDQGSL